MTDRVPNNSGHLIARPAADGLGDVKLATADVDEFHGTIGNSVSNKKFLLEK
jgi:hypothetical protein